MSIRLAMAIAFSSFAIAASASGAAAQSNPLVGAWSLVSVNDERPGSKTPLYGDNPAGLLIFDAQGRYSLQLCAGGRPKYASNDRTKGTPEEYRANAIGCNPHWGRYTLDEAKKVIVFRIEHAMFGNWESTVQNRSYAIENGMLRYSVPNPPVGGANPIVVWKKAE
ncbi:MAG: lipocalin-like domain-containing protein [Pseudolabrys sp.]